MSSPTIKQSPCSFEGNPDLYGLGIRLGVYLQTASVAVAALFQQTETLNRMSYSNGIFQFALTVGLWILTTTSPDTFRAVEAALVVLLANCASNQPPSSGVGLVLRRPWKREAVKRWIVDVALPLFRNGVESILLCYAVWFWFRGLDVLPRAEPTECTTYAFFFACVDLYGWVRTFGRIYSAFYLVIACVELTLWFKSRLRVDGQSRATRDSGETRTRGEEETDGDDALASDLQSYLTDRWKKS